MSPQQRAALVRESRLRKLVQKWGLISKKIRKKHAQIDSLGPAEGLEPSLLGKVTKWIEQIAGLHEKELDIISEIKEIEEKHHVLRKGKNLRRAKPSSATQKDLTCEADEEERPRERSWFWVLILWMLFSSGQKKKNEAPRNG